MSGSKKEVDESLNHLSVCTFTLYSSVFSCCAVVSALNTGKTSFVGVTSSFRRLQELKEKKWHSPLRASSTAPLHFSPGIMSTSKERDFKTSIELEEQSRDGLYDPHQPKNLSRASSRAASPVMPPSNANTQINSPVLSIAAYCGSSILMTVANKYCVNGTGWNLSFFLVAVQVSIHTRGP